MITYLREPEKSGSFVLFKKQGYFFDERQMKYYNM